MSIVHAILGTSDADTSLNEVQHRLAQDYLAIQLSIRDREQIINVLCRSQPDHLTDAVRSLVAAYEPMIRAVHNAVDLSATLYDFEVFLRDMIKVAKVPEQPRRGQPAQRPTVGDFVQLLKKHQGSSHKFMHQCAKNDKELTGWFHDYARTAASHFRRQKLQVSREKKGAVEERKPTHFTPNAGDLAEDLQTLYASLPPSKKEPIPPILDWHARHLEKLHNSSGARLRTVVTSPSTSSSSIAKLNSSSTPGSRTASPAPPPLPCRLQFWYADLENRVLWLQLKDAPSSCGEDTARCIHCEARARCVSCALAGPSRCHSHHAGRAVWQCKIWRRSKPREGQPRRLRSPVEGFILGNYRG